MVASAVVCAVNAEGSDAEEINILYPDNWVTVEASPGDTIRYEKSAPSSNYRFYGQVYFYHGSTDTPVDTALYTVKFTKLDSGRSGYFVLVLGESIPGGEYRVETKLYNSRVSSEPDTVYGFHLQVIGYDHTVTYDANGGEGDVGDTIVSDGNENADVVLAPNGFTKAGHIFTGWMVGDTVYQPGQSVSVGPNATVNAVAQWSQNTLSATANNISGVSGQAYSNQIGASANNGGTVSYAVKSCTGGTATVNNSGLVTYTAPSVSSTTSFTVTVTVTGTFAQGGSLTCDVSFTVTVDPVLSFTNAATSGTLSVKGA